MAGPTDLAAIRLFFEGAQARGQVPWQVWVKPLIGWLPLFVALHLGILCLVVILRRQWAEGERIAYPPRLDRPWLPAPGDPASRGGAVHLWGFALLPREGRYLSRVISRQGEGLRYACANAPVESRYSF